MANSNIVQLVKQIALEAVEASKPCDYRTGVVTGINPLEIKISQTLTLDESFLDLARNVTDFEILVNGQMTTIENALKVGEKVLMIRKSGGQRYTVIDRVVS